MIDPLFGPLVDDDLIEQGVIAHLQRWFPTYKQWWEERKNTKLLDIASWNPVSEDPESRWPEHHLPAVVVVCSGLHDAPVKHGDGSYDISVEVALAPVVSAADEHATRQLAHWYGALLRLALVQQGFEGTALEGLVDGVTWLHSEPALPDRTRRTLQAKSEVFVLELPNVLNAYKGPGAPEPDTDHEAPYTAESVSVDVVDSGEA